ncbi:TetR/AcrR family transcriptional regulator [Gordonia terrae]|uniref:TetR/AcrR family transcriptional regulator n=1 Tax=Gordonia terrae TaxID=2055 RepID=UPI003F6C91E4
MSTKAEGATTRRRLTPEARRAELISAGERLFGESPYDEVRMDDVASAAGVSRALMYRYFPDKRSLFVAVVDALSERMIARTVVAIDPRATPFEKIRTAVLGYLDAYAEHPHAADSIVLGAGASEPRVRDRDQADRARLRELIVEQFRIELATPLPEGTASLLRAVVGAWLAYTQEFIREWVIDRELDRDRIADLCAHTLLDTVVRLPGIPADLTIP